MDVFELWCRGAGISRCKRRIPSASRTWCVSRSSSRSAASAVRIRTASPLQSDSCCTSSIRCAFVIDRRDLRTSTSSHSAATTTLTVLLLRFQEFLQRFLHSDVYYTYLSQVINTVQLAQQTPSYTTKRRGRTSLPSPVT